MHFMFFSSWAVELVLEEEHRTVVLMLFNSQIDELLFDLAVE